jgi:hypothetical protein
MNRNELQEMKLGDSLPRWVIFRLSEAVGWAITEVGRPIYAEAFQNSGVFQMLKKVAKAMAIPNVVRNECCQTIRHHRARSKG